MERSKHDLWMAWREREDGDSFANLVTAELPVLIDFARRAGVNQADAEDVVQDALLALAKESGSRPAEVGIGAWLMRTVRFRSLTLLRSQRRRRGYEMAAAQRDLGRTQSERQDRGAVDQLLHALDSLSERDREVLLLRFRYDLDYADLAHVLGCTAATGRVRVHRALGRLRSRVGGDVRPLMALLPWAVVPASLIEFSRGAASMQVTGASAPLGGLFAMSTFKTTSTAVAAAALSMGFLLLIGFRLPEADLSQGVQGADVSDPTEHTGAKPPRVLATLEGTGGVVAELQAQIESLKEELRVSRASRPAETPADDTPIPAEPAAGRSLLEYLKWITELPKKERMAACNQLARRLEVGDDSALEAIRILRESDDEDVLRVLVLALQFGGVNGIDDDELPNLFAVFKDESRALRRVMLLPVMLQAAHRAHDVAAVKQMLQDESDPTVLVKLLPLVAGHTALHDKDWLLGFAERHEKREVRVAAATAYAQRGGTAVRELLESTLAENSTEDGVWHLGFLKRITQGPITIAPPEDLPEHRRLLGEVYRRLRSVKQRRQLVDRVMYAVMDSDTARGVLEDILPGEEDEALRTHIQNRLKLRDLFR